MPRGRSGGQDGSTSTEVQASDNMEEVFSVRSKSVLSKSGSSGSGRSFGFARTLRSTARLHARQFKDGKGHPFPFARRIIMTQTFEVTIIFIILANCGFIGYQAENRDLEGLHGLLMQLAEHFFTFCFFTDLVLRMLGYGWTWALDSTNYLDVFLVCLSVLVTWIMQPAGMSGGLLRKLTVLRMLRLVRIARAVRLRPEFKEMWSLLKGLVDSAETLLWTYVMICVLLYFFAIMTTSLIGQNVAFKNPDNPAIAALVEDRFGNVPRSMLTLFAVMTLDEWNLFIRPLMAVDGQVWVGFFMVFFITISNFLLMNLITAVIVENAFDDSKADEEELAQRLALQKEEELQDLKLVFKAMDDDGSGMLTRDELENASTKRKVQNKLRSLDILPKDLDELWDILDNGDGELSADDFVNGLYRFRGEAKAKDIIRIYRELVVLEASVHDIGVCLDTSEEKMTLMKTQLQSTKVDIRAMQRTVAKAREAVKQAALTQSLR